MMACILVIDDDELVRATINSVLTSAGHRVILAADGEQGLRAFEEKAPDLVITDIWMPGREGIEIVRTLRRGNPEIGIVAISGGGTSRAPNGSAGSEVDYLEFALKLGASCILRKPFRPKELLERVEACLPAVSSVTGCRPSASE